MSKMAGGKTGNITIEYDGESGEYYVVWKPLVIGAGKAVIEALQDLREAAHAGVDTIIDLKLKDIIKEA
jgi:predicted RNase H-like HicB family nuclease